MECIRMHIGWSAFEMSPSNRLQIAASVSTVLLAFKVGLGTLCLSQWMQGAQDPNKIYP